MKKFICFLFSCLLFVFLISCSSDKEEELFVIENDVNYLKPIASYKDDMGFTYDVLHRGVIRNYLIDMKAKVNSNSGKQKYVYEKQEVEEKFSIFEKRYISATSNSFKEEVSAGISLDIYGMAEASLVSTIGFEQKFDSSVTVRNYFAESKKTAIKERYEFEFDSNIKNDGFYVIGLFCDADYYSIIITKEGSYSILDYSIPQNVVLSCLYVGNGKTNKPEPFDFNKINVNRIRRINDIIHIKNSVDTKVYFTNPDLKVEQGKKDTISFDLSSIDFEKYVLLGYSKVSMYISYYIVSDYHLFNWGTSASVLIKLDKNKIYEKSHSIQSSSSSIFAYDNFDYDVSDFKRINYIITEIICNGEYVSCYLKEYKVKIVFSK